jgi:L-lactate permease
LPVVVLLGLLAFWHVRAHLAALAGLIAAALIAVFVYQMPAPLTGIAALNGAVFGLSPCCAFLTTLQCSRRCPIAPRGQSRNLTCGLRRCC